MWHAGSIGFWVVGVLGFRVFGVEGTILICPLQNVFTCHCSPNSVCTEGSRR